ncbi:MAG: ribonuclease H [Candidatus Saccharibacteria bacterium]|nr:ribonuclease H [Candidatus Saccharibacteria bacterium]
MKILWTDGSASPNPGPGGYAVIENGKPVRLGRENPSTNIRMEGWAMVAAMEYAGAEGCEIHSDSEFWINVLTKWAPGWKARGWKKSKGEIMNLEIVKKLDELYQKYPVKLVWVRGHVGTEMNELADQWANRAREGMELV